MKRNYVLLAGLLLASANAMACYTVFDRNDRILYQGMDAPVDMSLHLKDALQRRYPAGSQMVFDQAKACGPVGVAQVPRSAVGDVPANTIRMERSARRSSSAPSPLFTDKVTAERNQLPHTQVASNIVMVPPAAADRAVRATVTVLPSETFAGTNLPDTRAMGAGPSRRSAAPDTTAMGAAATPVPAPRRQVVITEFRDPPMTVIEGGGGVTTRQY